MSSFISILCSSTLLVCNDIRDVAQHVQPSPSGTTRVLVPIDFDDTLVMSGCSEAFHLGGLAWRKDLRKYLEELKQTGALLSDDSLLGCLTLFLAKSLPAKAVQNPETAELIKTLENLGCKVMIFTARGRSGENAWYKLCISGVDILTKEQLNQAGIEIAQESTSLEHKQIFENRMIFAQNGSKENLLLELFDKKIINPSEYHQVIFIDDKQDAIAKLRAPIEAYQIPYTGIHYTYIENAEKKEYDILKSTIQLTQLIAKRTLLNPQELDTIYAQLKAQNISAPDFFKKILIQLDEALKNDGVYEQSDLDTEQLFEKIKQAVDKSNYFSSPAFSIQDFVI